jgi:hypothetical protein
MNRYYTQMPPHFRLSKKKPQGFIFYLLVFWAVMIGMLIVFPKIVDKIIWFPSLKIFNPLGILTSPASWGSSKNINIGGFLLSAFTLYFFGDEVKLKMGKIKFYIYLFYTVSAGFFVFLFISFFTFTGVATFAPNIAIAVAYAMYRVHFTKHLVYKSYLVGKLSYIPWFLYISITLFLIINLVKGQVWAHHMSYLITLIGANIFFDKGIPKKLLMWHKKKRWSHKNGIWKIRR